MQKVIKTDFYDTFNCIADKCSITCCQEWKIAVDNDTLNKWNNICLSGENELSKYVNKGDESGVIELNENKKCPFLNDNKLCNLVINFGDNVLSNTCATFPRQIHEYYNRKEYSLVACCPEVIDILDKQNKININSDINDSSEDILFNIRRLMINIAQNNKLTVSKSIMINFYILLELYENKNIDIKIVKVYEDEKLINKLSNTINKMDFSKLDTFDENNELFLDLAVNYRKEGLYTSFLEEIAVLAEKLSIEYEEDYMNEKILLFENEFKKYETLFSNYLVNEIYTNVLMPQSDLESMIVMFQWIGMEYIIIRHVIFLKWLVNQSLDLSYEMVRDYIVIISRMTGYDDEDIYEYLNNSFESVVWEWGYMALIAGN